MDNTGARFDFTVAADMAETIVWAFARMGGEAFDLSGASFEAVVTDAARAEVASGMSVQHGSATGELLVQVAALPAAVYGYEVWAAAAEGGRSRVLYGSLTAVSSSAAMLLAQEASSFPFRTLDVYVPDAVGAPLLLAWKSGSVAGALAQLAAQHAAAAAGAAAEAAETARAAADALAAGQEQMDEALAAVSDKVQALNAVVAVWDGKIQSAIVLNPETGTLWIGGIDTGCRYQGDPGKCPYISERDTWMVWDDGLGGWRDTGKPVRGEDGFSPYINALGNWVTLNPLTGEPEDSGCAAAGRDGLDGAAVRRVVVETEGDLPTEPELCNGGVYCYVPLRDAPAVAMLTVHEGGRAADDRLVVDGVEISLPAPGTEPSEAAAALAEALAEAGFTAAAEGATVSLVGDCRHAFVFDELNEDGYSVEVHVGMCREHEYSVYAWLELPDGSASWACVGEANDFATAEVAGIVKLATDVCCEEGGAPVAVNKHRQMVVPHADYSTPGAVLPSVAATLGSGDGGVGFDASGRMRAQAAQVGLFGAVSLSFAGICEVACVGLMADGSIGLPWATLYQGGAMKLGSVFNQLNRIPYQVGVGATPDHQLCNNLLFGGALKHMKRAAWTGTGMEWIDGESGYYNGSDYYLGLHTSAQFSQSEEEGLTLLSASGSLLAGVYLAVDMADARGNAVPCASMVNAWVADYAYSKPECDEKFETKAHAEATWETREYARTTYETKPDAQSMDQALRLLVANVKSELQTRIDGKVSATDEWCGDVVLTQDQYNALASVDDLKLYLIVEE